VQELSARFIAAADASDRLQSKACRDEDALLFQKFSGRRTIASQRAGPEIGQGQYAVAPSGELLASCASADPREVAAMMEAALAKWSELPREKRLLTKAPEAKAAGQWQKWEKHYPVDGLVLWVVSRDLPRGSSPPAFPKAWNQDYAWFRKAEAQAFLPDPIKVNATHEVPRPLVERLAQFHLVDNVRALNYAYFPKEAIQEARLAATVSEVKDDVATVRFEGRTRASMDGPFKQGYEPKLVGRARYNVKRQKFISFELVAVGMRWGAGNCNLRHDDAEPAPMGIVLRLAGDSSAERLPPAFLSKYGW
jgi:hypothetical protein